MTMDAVMGMENRLIDTRAGSGRSVALGEAAEMSFDDMAAHMGVNMGSQQRRVVHTAIPRQDMGHVLHDDVDVRYALKQSEQRGK